LAGCCPNFRALFGDRVDETIAATGRPARAEEIATVAAFLLSDAAGWMNGATVSIDGGIGALQTIRAITEQRRQSPSPAQSSYREVSR
jgi:NAD(P)-dependent dehydrogenase (short-subunit alcohol dehydrogenase family)